MSLRFDTETLDNAICCYQLRTEEPLDEVVLACLCELKELRGRLTCNDFNNGYNQALEDMAEKIKALRYDKSENGGESYYTTQAFSNRDIDEIVKQLRRGVRE